MMIKVFSLYDSKAEAFIKPFMLLQEGVAVRELTDAVNQADTNVGQHPEDYILYHIADFDNATGEYINHNPHKLLTNCLSLKTKPKTVNIDFDKLIKENEPDIKAVI